MPRVMPKPAAPKQQKPHIEGEQDSSATAPSLLSGRHVGKDDPRWPAFQGITATLHLLCSVQRCSARPAAGDAAASVLHWSQLCCGPCNFPAAGPGGIEGVLARSGLMRPPPCMIRQAMLRAVMCWLSESQCLSNGSAFVLPGGPYGTDAPHTTSFGRGASRCKWGSSIRFPIGLQHRR